VAVLQVLKERKDNSAKMPNGCEESFSATAGEKQVGVESQERSGWVCSSSTSPPTLAMGWTRGWPPLRLGALVQGGCAQRGSRRL